MLVQMQFPDLDAENLDGRAFSYPRDFGARTIVLVAFDLKQRSDLESWVPFVDRHVRSGAADGRVFPALSRSMRIMKRVIVTTMRKGAPTAEARAATFPVFVDLDEFCAELGITDRALIHVFVVAAGGVVLGHYVGGFSASSAVAIEAQLEVSV